MRGVRVLSAALWVTSCDGGKGGARGVGSGSVPHALPRMRIDHHQPHLLPAATHRAPLLTRAVLQAQPTFHPLPDRPRWIQDPDAQELTTTSGGPKTMTQNCADVIVIGLGGHGSAAAAHLAARGVRVIGIEQFPPAHSKGSSHGHSRIIRQAYFEDPRYVPLLKRSFELWRQLQKDSGTQLLHMTGGLMIGDPSTGVIRGTLASVRKHNLQHKILTSSQIHSMYPVFNPRPNEIGVLEEEAGYLVPEACITAYVEQASKFGAQLHFDTKAYHWSVDADGKVTVITDKGKFVSTHLILSVGAWAQQMYAGSLRLPLKVERRVLYWFEPKHDAQMFARIPVYIWDTGRQGENFYGFPTQPGVPGVKVAYHLMDPKDRDQSVCTADTVQRSVSETETSRIKGILADRMPALPGNVTSTATCMYTTTPDEHFIICAHPKHPQVTIASPCSGHGFKFCSVVGEILADLAIQRTTRHDISLFALDSKRLAAWGHQGYSRL